MEDLRTLNKVRLRLTKMVTRSVVWSNDAVSENKFDYITDYFLESQNSSKKKFSFLKFHIYV